MADTITVPRKHHSGLDADKASITGAIGETYAATDSNKFYYWNVPLAAWKTGEGYEFVSRDASAWDKDTGDFTTDATWKVNGLDLSGIVPAGAIAVKLRFYVLDDAAGSIFSIRKSATADWNIIRFKTKVANIEEDKVEDVAIEFDRLLDYFGSNLVFTTLGVTVLGWYI